jgi:hypothetical protein
MAVLGVKMTLGGVASHGDQKHFCCHDDRSTVVGMLIEALLLPW